ncbi:MAG TPA: EsaB/YukD family protein [Actinoplanes sp.]|nr:EsaB/YukD family protein [Actinoplanes sp.]
MSAPATSGPSLARVTIAAPTRRLDLALPDNMLVAELLPHLLRHAEGALGEPSERYGGWVLPGVIALAVSVACAVLGILLSRAFGDASAGGVVAASGLPYAFLGGAWLLTQPGGGFLSVGAPGLVLGSSALLVVSVLGHAGVAGLTRLFVAGIAAALTGLLAAMLALSGVSAEGAAAVALTTAIGLLPAYPVLAGWLGRLPFPDLPSRAEEILKPEKAPRRADVFAAVVRASEVLTGFLLSAALCSIVAMTWLALSTPDVPAVLLMVAAITALLLRARLLPTPQQRVPLLAAGLLGLAGLGVGPVVTGAVSGVVLVAVAALVTAVALPAALIYSRRAPSPYLGRAADILDIVAIMALIPLACAVIGVFDDVRGLFASIGG